MFRRDKNAARLTQWAERTEPVGLRSLLARYGQRKIVTRLGLVTCTVATVALLLAWWGEPCSYRIGEIYPYDLRVRTAFEIVNQPTEDARTEGAEVAAAPPVIEKYPADRLLVRRGQPIREPQLALLQEEHRAYLRGLTSLDRVRRDVAQFVLIALLACVVTLYVLRFQQVLIRSFKRLAHVCMLTVLTLAFALLLSKAPWHAALIPLTVTAMVLTIAYHPQFALLMSFSLALVAAVALNAGLAPLLVMMGGLATTVLLLPDLRSRYRLVQVGAGAGLAFLAMTIATGLLTGQTAKLIVSDAVRHLTWGVLAGFLLTGSLPLVERIFGLVTDLSLLRLADGSHPLLQELIRRAPGTYTHSMTVATLAEAAAETIRANPLLVRVGSYYHDVGKLMKPHYFIENQAGENRHDGLEPALSTLVIMGHVKDGLALAGQYNLPRAIIAFIQQHHGTTLVEYFYREAIRLYEGDSGALEPSFRYPGPKPQSREVGIVMLADAVEGSSRALRDPTPSSLTKLVRDLVMKRLLDGQFEESGLTLSELHRIEKSLCKSVIALYHSRVRYPEGHSKRAAS